MLIWISTIRYRSDIIRKVIVVSLMVLILSTTLSSLPARGSQTESRVYAADQGDGKVKIFDMNGNFISEFSAPELVGQALQGIDSDQDGNIYVATVLNGKILKFSPDGTLLLTINNGTADDVEIDSQGNIYQPDEFDNVVKKYDSNGNFISELTGFEVPVNVAIDSNNNLYVLDYPNFDAVSGIKKFDSSGTFLTQWNDTSPSLLYINTDSQGNIYASDYNGRIIKYDGNGNVQLDFSISFPYGLAINSTGYIYVSAVSKIQVYDQSGILQFEFGQGVLSNVPDIEIVEITSSPIDDVDGDGISVLVDTLPAIFSNDFNDIGLGGTTFGIITTRGDQILSITEEPNPAGVRISAALSGGTTPASVSVCGDTSTLSLNAGDEVIVTCGSVIVKVITGQVEVVLDANTGATTTATMSAGDSLTFEPSTFTLESNSGTPSITFVAPDSTVATLDLPTGNSLTVDPTTFAITAAQTNPDTIVVFVGEEQHSLSSGSTVFADTTPPDITFSGSINDGNSFYFGDVPASPTCSAFDNLSGVSGSCTVTGYSTAVGTHTLTASAADNAGNVGTSTITYSVLAWTISGFYQPVDMGNVLNTINNGRTVPMKFEVFKGTTELTDTAIVTLSLKQVTCGTGMFIDDIEITTTGNTSLRYDPASGQFIYNWKTPSTANICYDVVLTTSDTSAITAHFKLK